MSICLHPTATFKGLFTSPCSSNWVGMYFIATIDKSHWKRIELITSSASKVYVRATHSGVPERRWNVRHKVDLKCSNTAMVQSTMSLWNLLSLLFCRPFYITTWPLKKKKKFARKRTDPILSQPNQCVWVLSRPIISQTKRYAQNCLWPGLTYNTCFLRSTGKLDYV